MCQGLNKNKAYQDIDQAVAQIRTFPDDAERPEVSLQARQRGVMRIGLFGDVDVWTLRQLAERLRDQLLNQPAISQVNLGNVPDYVTHVEISHERLREYGLTLGEVARIIEQSSRDVPAGSIDTSGGEILLRINERKQWSEQLAGIVVVSSDTGAPVMLGDIATLTGGTLISEDLGIQLENLTLDQLGQAKKITIDKGTTTTDDDAEEAGRHGECEGEQPPRRGGRRDCSPVCARGWSTKIGDDQARSATGARQSSSGSKRGPLA